MKIFDNSFGFTTIHILVIVVMVGSIVLLSTNFFQNIKKTPQTHIYGVVDHPGSVNSRGSGGPNSNSSMQLQYLKFTDPTPINPVSSPTPTPTPTP